MFSAKNGGKIQIQLFSKLVFNLKSWVEWFDCFWHCFVDFDLWFSKTSKNWKNFVFSIKGTTEVSDARRNGPRRPKIYFARVWNCFHFKTNLSFVLCFQFSLLFSLVGLVLCSIVCHASDKESSIRFNRSMVSSLNDKIIKSNIIGLHFSFGFQLCWGNLRQPVIPTSHLYYFLKQEWSAGYIPTMKPSKLSTVCKPMLPSWKKSKVKD